MRHQIRGTGIGDWLRINARRWPDRKAVLDRGLDRDLTFAELDERVNRLANGLVGVGVGRADRVAILATDSHRYLETMLACAKLGATAVALNSRLTFDELAALLSASGSGVLLGAARYRPTIDRLRAEPPSTPVVIDFDASDDGAGAIGYEPLLARSAADDPNVRVDDDEILSLAFTSGTTGTPKGVLQSQRMIKALVTAQIVETEVRQDDCRYSAAPLFHVAGYALVLQGILRGFPSVLNASFDPAATLAWMRDGQLTGCFMVPTMLASLLEQPAVEDARYERLRIVQYGAAPMYPSLLRRAAAVFGCDFVQGFGAGTEAGAQAFLSPADHRRALAGEEHLLGSVGRPALGVEMRICDDDWNDVAPGEIGEIVTRSDQTMSGYDGLPETSAAALHPDGWFRAGDLGRFDEEGYLYLAGRARDMLIRGGENVYPIEVETVLAELPGIVEVAVVGKPDPHWGEVVCAHVVCDPAGPSWSGDALRDRCRERLAAFKVPTEWVFHDALPKNASGKILKRELVKRTNEVVS